jgi:hypothetical protein
MTYAISAKNSPRSLRVKVVYTALFLLVATSCAGGFKKDLAQAEATYNSGDKEGAKEFYEAAANKGSAEAHFSLAHRYIVSHEEQIYHYSKAAELGHEEALEQALDVLLFRANSLTMANPERALELYYIAKERNPSIELFNEEGDLRTMQKCAEAGEIDALEFCQRYSIDPSKEDIWYGVWKLAEEASMGGRFGEPDPKLVFQLVARGGNTPAELGYAVRDFYEFWKAGMVVEFNICDYITSGFGMGFCAHRWNEDAEAKRQARILQLSKTLNLNTKRLLSLAYSSAATFVKTKAVNEEGHGGSGRPAWIIESESGQKDSLLELISRISKGYTPEDVPPFSESDSRLSETYHKVRSRLPFIRENWPDYPTPYQLDKVKKTWPDYRDNMAELFAALNPSLEETHWRSWLTELRQKQLLRLLLAE